MVSFIKNFGINRACEEEEKDEEDIKEVWTPLMGYSETHAINLDTLRVRKIQGGRMLRVTSTGLVCLSGKWVHVADVVCNHRQSTASAYTEINTPTPAPPMISPLRMDTWVNICLVLAATVIVWNREEHELPLWTMRWPWT